MIPIPSLTPELLRELGKELNGCDFTEENQRSFLSATESLDVQAAPGNGKTTLLVAKLALLSRSWSSRTQGVCVISHTNAARDEIEKKLFKHPLASAFSLISTFYWNRNLFYRSLYCTFHTCADWVGQSSVLMMKFFPLLLYPDGDQNRR